MFLFVSLMTAIKLIKGIISRQKLASKIFGWFSRSFFIPRIRKNCY